MATLNTKMMCGFHTEQYFGNKGLYIIFHYYIPIFSQLGCQLVLLLGKILLLIFY